MENLVTNRVVARVTGAVVEVRGRSADEGPRLMVIQTRQLPAKNIAAAGWEVKRDTITHYAIVGEVMGVFLVAGTRRWQAQVLDRYLENCWVYKLAITSASLEVLEKFE